MYVREYRDKYNGEFPLNNHNKGYLYDTEHRSLHLEKKDEKVKQHWKDESGIT